MTLSSPLAQDASVIFHFPSDNVSGEGNTHVEGRMAMEARIIEITPPRGPIDLHIWQIETRSWPGAPWHRCSEGPDTNTEPVILRMRVQQRDWNLLSDASEDVA